MGQLELTAEKRVIIGKHVKQIRKQGLVPAVVFGHAIEPMSIQIPAKELRLAMAGRGGSHLISLKIEGQDQPVLALPREIQRDVLTAAIQHIDFQAVVMTEKIRTEASLTFVGQSPAVLEGTGVLFHNMDSVEMECLPGDLINSIQVDLSGLAQIDDTIHVRDLQDAHDRQDSDPREEPVVRVSTSPSCPRPRKKKRSEPETSRLSARASRKKKR